MNINLEESNVELVKASFDNLPEGQIKQKFQRSRRDNPRDIKEY